jgi:hypothetical protein
MGGSFVLRTPEVACVTAVPTTTAPFTLWNGEAQPSATFPLHAGGLVYVIDAIGWLCTTSAGAASMFQLLALIPKLPVAAQPDTAGTLVINGQSGQPYSGLAKVSVTVTVVDDGWFSAGNKAETPLTATGGLGLEVAFEGGLIVPPGHLLALACLAVNTTAKGKFMIRYHEVELPVVT